jgi:hypothetical protein
MESVKIGKNPTLMKSSEMGSSQAQRKRKKFILRLPFFLLSSGKQNVI